MSLPAHSVRLIKAGSLVTIRIGPHSATLTVAEWSEVLARPLYASPPADGRPTIATDRGSARGAAS